MNCLVLNKATNAPPTSVTAMLARAALHFLLRTLLRVSMFVLPVLAAGVCRADWFQDTRPIMGTQVHVELWADDSAKAQATIAAITREREDGVKGMVHLRNRGSEPQGDVRGKTVSRAPRLFFESLAKKYLNNIRRIQPALLD